MGPRQRGRGQLSGGVRCKIPTFRWHDMLPLNDPRWNTLAGGYKTPYDPSDALRRIEAGKDAWDELWQELHHQGDVGEASYAAVPHLVRIAKLLPRRDWNFYGLVSTIEVERHRKSNGCDRLSSHRNPLKIRMGSTSQHR